MFAGACIGSNNLARSSQFYKAVLSNLGMHESVSNDFEIGYADRNGDAYFWVLSPYNKQVATAGNGSQMMFKALDEDQVKQFYAAVIENGGSCEGPPGLRDYHPGYFGAYCRDLDGNKLHVFFRPTS